MFQIVHKVFESS